MSISAFLCLLVIGIFVTISSVQIVVSPYQQECFYEEVETSNKLTGSFEVIAGGGLDIDCTITGPGEKVHYSTVRQKQGQFGVIAQQGGLYKLCFSNRMSTISEKTVAFSLHVGDKLYQDIAKQEHVTPLEREITQLSDQIAMIEDEQRYVFSRERAARDQSESINDRVKWWSIIEAVIMVVVGSLQIFYLVSFFSKKRLY
jgi:p24 family protein beta-1